MRIQVLPAGQNAARLEVNGMINLQGFFQIEEAILKVIKKNCFRVEMDMSQVKHMDYRGVEILLKRAERLRSYGGDLILSNLSPYLVNILRMAGAAESFEITGNGDAPQGDLFKRQDNSQEDQPLSAVA
jgi:anti-anti-sigma factor